MSTSISEPPQTFVAGRDVNIHDVEVLDLHNFKDRNFGYEKTNFYYDNPAHEHTLPDGTIHSNTMAFHPLNATAYQQW